MAQSPKKSTYPFWAPRFWHGMRFGPWYQLAKRSGFRVHPLRWGLAGTVTGMTIFNSVLERITSARTRDQVRNTPLVADPIFVLGHWRSGTTLLHELMSCDSRFATPTTFQCFAANHFLLTESWLPKLLWFIMPSKRPMDNVKTGWDLPQEDEFALCSLGSPSPYLRIAFPNEPHRYLEYLDLVGLPQEEKAAWQSSLNRFLHSLTVAHRKQLILKSPTHTARIGPLWEMFPKAKFLHIVRDPMSVFPSTMNLWQVLDEAQGLQIPHHRGLKEYVLQAFEQMYDAFESQRQHVPSDQVYDLRYEDLVASPIEKMREAYDALSLGSFENIEPALRKMLDAKQGYSTNRYELDEETRSEVMSRWSDFATRYGYAS